LRSYPRAAVKVAYRPGGLRTLLLIDEMPALGHLGPLEDAFGLVHGYKVQIAGICQDLAQLKALYKERWESSQPQLGRASVSYGFLVHETSLFTGYLPPELTISPILACLRSAPANE
jgi:hypothetical protein